MKYYGQIVHFGQNQLIHICKMMGSAIRAHTRHVTEILYLPVIYLHIWLYVKQNILAKTQYKSVYVVWSIEASFLNLNKLT